MIAGTLVTPVSPIAMHGAESALRPGETLTEDELIAYCKDQIANFKIPRYVRFITEWPMSATKIQKFKLRQEIADELAAAGITEIGIVVGDTQAEIRAAVGDGSDFRNGRHMAAWLGLVPRQFSSGDKAVLMGISKRGSQHLRSLLVHGARAVVRTAPNKNDPISQWANQLRERRGFNRATVAIANKNARIIWAVLRTGDQYRAAA